jgi:hypothetical protein
VTGGKFVAMIEDTALFYVLAWSVFQLIVHHLTSSTVFMPFFSGSFLIVGDGEKAQFSDPLIL